MKMELDKDTLEKIIETHTTCVHILHRLEQGETQFKEHSKRMDKHNGRIRKLEQQQQLLTGKLAIIIMGIGSIVTIIFNALLWAWYKLPNR